MLEIKKKFTEPEIKVVEIDSSDIICTSNISTQSEEPEDIGYGGRF